MKKYRYIILPIIISMITTIFILALYFYGIDIIVNKIKLIFTYLFYLALPVAMYCALWRVYRLHKIQQIQKQELTSLFNMIDVDKYKEREKENAGYLICLFKDFYNAVKIYDKNFCVPSTLCLEMLTKDNSPEEFSLAFTIDHFRLYSIYSHILNNWNKVSNKEYISTIVEMLPK